MRISMRSVTTATALPSTIGDGGRRRPRRDAPGARQNRSRADPPTRTARGRGRIKVDGGAPKRRAAHVVGQGAGCCRALRSFPCSSRPVSARAQRDKRNDVGHDRLDRPHHRRHRRGGPRRAAVDEGDRHPSRPGDVGLTPGRVLRLSGGGYGPGSTSPSTCPTGSATSPTRGERRGGGLAVRGWIFVSCDHLLVGESSAPRPRPTHLRRRRRRQHGATVAHVGDALADGLLVDGFPPGCPTWLGPHRGRSVDQQVLPPSSSRARSVPMRVSVCSGTAASTPNSRFLPAPSGGDNPVFTAATTASR